ncbi:MAG: hypothetical protein JW833_04415 [Prolixibacteraceae bacterium]|nr:hypothetical protein [Prolixibacteraceae bacterium]
MIYLTGFSLLSGVLPTVASLIVFLFLVKKHILLNKERKKTKVLIQICKNEIQALSHQFTQFENGEEFKDPSHHYSYDLDVFGEGSLFQYLNRTSTISGKRVLAKWIQKPFLEEKEIIDRQEAVKEIAVCRDWRLDFLADGRVFDESVSQHDEVVGWSKKSLIFKNYNLIKWLKLVLPVLTILMLVPAVWINRFVPLYLCVGIQWLFMYFYRKRIKEYFRFFGQKAQLIEKYVLLLKKISESGFKSSWLIQKQEIISKPEPAEIIIGTLGKLVREFEYRQNILVGFILNSFFLWDVRCVFHLQKWHKKNHVKLPEWLEVIENLDALISLANFADNHPEYKYPIPVEGEFGFKASNLGHPLLHPEKRVCSDFQIDGWSKAIIVTGANMAGKSTFLRAVGVNLILARLGAPVCASEFLFKPVELFTNMRTTDSLFNDESYFYAELKRLGFILEDLKRGRELFVILDEMLKGTNSIDKLNGSRELIRKLIQFKAVALIATHDLKLSEMEKELPGNVSNKCFEIKIIDDELIFDYKLSDGVTNTMNATFLMKKMGII